MPDVQLAVTVDGPDDAPVLVLANPIGTNAGIWRHQVPVHFAHVEAPGPVTDALRRHFLRNQA